MKLFKIETHIGCDVSNINEPYIRIDCYVESIENTHVITMTMGDWSDKYESCVMTIMPMIQECLRKSYETASKQSE